MQVRLMGANDMPLFQNYICHKKKQNFQILDFIMLHISDTKLTIKSIHTSIFAFVHLGTSTTAWKIF